MRILAKKEQSGEHPKNTKFTLAEAGMLMQGLHHDQEEEEELNIEEHEVHTNYLGRDDSFKNQKLSEFDQPPRKAAPRSRRKT